MRAEPCRVLVVAPHRDDEAIGCGGTLCAHAERGDTTSVVHLSGEQGATPEEAQIATGILGVSRLYTLSAEAVQLVSTQGLLLELVGVLREVQPAVIYAPHEQEDDPVHKVAATVAKEATWLASYPAYPEVGAPLATPVREVLTYEVWTPLPEPTTFVDITGYVGRKQESLRSYHSQMSIARWDEGALGLNRYRGVTSGVGDYAEAFTVSHTQHRLSLDAD